MESIKTQSPSKRNFIGLLGCCFVYINIVQLAHAIHRANEFPLGQGEEGPSPFYVDVFWACMVLMPFLAWLVKLLSQYGFAPLCSCVCRAAQKHWLKFAAYLVLLYLVTWSFYAWDFHLVFSPYGPELQLPQTTIGYIAVIWCHFMDEGFDSILFLALAPIFCYVAWDLRRERATLIPA